MLKLTFVPLLFLFTASLFAQVTEVERSISSLQFNLGSYHFVQEVGLSKSSTLRIEAGTEVNSRWTFGDEADERNNYFALRPVLGVGARHYYNLDKREESGRITSNNSGNFVTIMAEYRPGFFLYNSNDRIRASDQFEAKALWGLRRQLGEHWDFEFTAGVRLNVNQLRIPAYRIFNRNLVIGWRFGYRF